MQVNQARLMQSEITGRYIIFGSCSRHKSHSRGRNTWVRSNQIQKNESFPSNDEVLISIKDSISLNEVDNMEIGLSTDWLGVEQEVQACTITADMDRNQPNGQDNANQEGSDLLPFDPDYQEAEAQKLISNLPKLNDCEFDHNYILHHLEQQAIDPILCS